MTQFRSGITPDSYANWLVRKFLVWRPGSEVSFPAIIFNLVCTVPAYLRARQIGIYDGLPARYADMTCYNKILPAHKLALADLESYYHIRIDRSELTAKGRDVYDADPSELYGPRYWLNEPLEIGLTPDRIDC